MVRAYVARYLTNLNERTDSDAHGIVAPLSCGHPAKECDSSCPPSTVTSVSWAEKHSGHRMQSLMATTRELRLCA
jgi:hypothetical protein